MKPSDGERGEALPIPLEDQPVRDLAHAEHVVALESRGVRHAESPEEDEHGRYDTQAEADAPDRAQVVVAKDPEKNKRSERGDDEAEVDHGVFKIA